MINIRMFFEKYRSNDYVCCFQVCACHSGKLCFPAGIHCTQPADYEPLI